MRSGLVQANATAPITPSSAGRMKIRSLTPEKNSAPSAASAMIIAVPMSRPAMTVARTRIVIGTSGISTWGHDPSSVRLRKSTKPIHSASVSLRNSDGWA